VGVTKAQAKETAPPAEAPPAYEDARDQLTELVKRLEAGGLTLEQSLDLWERGEQLAAICEEWLEGARARLAAAMAQRGEASRGENGHRGEGRRAGAGPADSSGEPF
jgi:exodeoxyribonuclease VII small subunit